MIKTLNKLGIEETFLNIVKAIFKKPTVIIILDGERLKVFFFSSKVKNKARILTLTTTTEHSTGSPSQSNWT